MVGLAVLLVVVVVVVVDGRTSTETFLFFQPPTKRVMAVRVSGMILSGHYLLPECSAVSIASPFPSFYVDLRLHCTVADVRTE